VRSTPPTQQACRVAVEDRSAGFAHATSRVRQPRYSRDRSSAPKAHLRELGAQSSHGRPARSPTWVASRQLLMHRANSSSQRERSSANRNNEITLAMASRSRRHFTRRRDAFRQHASVANLVGQQQNEPRVERFGLRL
jgi:hypothetical protein